MRVGVIGGGDVCEAFERGFLSRDTGNALQIAVTSKCNASWPLRAETP